jgi:hypothetical protein
MCSNFDLTSASLVSVRKVAEFELRSVSLMFSKCACALDLGNSRVIRGMALSPPPPLPSSSVSFAIARLIILTNVGPPSAVRDKFGCFGTVEGKGFGDIVGAAAAERPSPLFVDDGEFCKGATFSVNERRDLCLARVGREGFSWGGFRKELFLSGGIVVIAAIEHSKDSV